MKKILYIFLTLLSVQVSAQIEQPRIKLNQVIKDSTGSGRIVISSLLDSNMVYSTDLYINPLDSTLVLFGTPLGAGSLSSVNVDSIYLFGDGAINPIYLDKQKLLDSIASATFQQQFTAIANDSSYTVSIADLPQDVNSILVFQNGQVLDKNMFTILDNTITLSYQPEVGDRVVVMWFSGNIVNISGSFVTLSGNETISGAKTFTTGTIFNGTTTFNNSANFDNNTLYIDDVNNKVGIGTNSLTSKLEVNGSATNLTSNNEGADTSIDFSLSNIAVTSSTSSTIALTNIKDGGAYTLIITGSATTTVTFSATDFTFKYMGTVDRTSSKHHIYSFIVVGSIVYVTMATEN